MFQQGLEHHKAGRNQQAIQAYSEAIKQDGSLVEAHLNLGAIFYEQGEYEKAEREFSWVVRKDPSRAVAHENYAKTLEQLGKDNEALREWQDAETREERPTYKESARKQRLRLEQKIRQQSSQPSDVDIPPSFDVPPNPNDLALVIGIEKYQHVPNVPYARADARTVEEYLHNLGYEPRNVESLLNEQATLANLKIAVESTLPRRVKPDSRVFLYYAGHGSPDPLTGDTYLLPHDGRPDHLTQTGYALTDLYAQLGELEASQVVVAIDACFSGIGDRSVSSTGRSSKITPPVLAAPRVAAITATHGDQISFPKKDQPHGLFTYYFLKAIQDGHAHLGEIFDTLGPQVENDARLQGHAQSPSLRSSAPNARAFSLWGGK
ncbi:hypothetical protein YTPLAS18_17880 [Nitrospira sp.]|nr:hypothetical protein YTPLAS18_17880 [Nitrospira sp.]